MKPKIVLVGGGSVNWAPTLINDFTLTPELQSAQYTILDTNQEAGYKMVEFGWKLIKERGLQSSFDYTADQKQAFTGADFIIITISTGGLDAMEYDLKIPEDYKIYHTVGDTVGPGGWVRSLRNIPVFYEIAININKYAPNAVVLNYTNPLSTLTKVLCEIGKFKTVGLCHGLFEVYNVLMKIFGLESEEEIKLRIGGINHFFWILDMNIKGEDGYELLKKKMQNRSFAQLVKETCADEAGTYPDKWVCSELLEHISYLPYIGDRHICEFFSCYIVGDLKTLEMYKLKRTTVQERKRIEKERREKLESYINGKEGWPNKRSRETAADIIKCFLNKHEFVDVVNLPNNGQIANLPRGTIVETMGIVNGLGFTPLSVGDLPEPIVNLVLPHAINQNMIVEASLEGDLEKAFWVLYNDPLCKHLNLPQIREMGIRLLEAHREYLPQFYNK